MLNRTNYLLTLLIEECQEVSQRACKAIRFGLKDRQGSIEGEPVFPPNDERLVGELQDLITVIQMLQENGNLPAINSSLVKKNKVEKYIKYSIDLGMAEPGTDKTNVAGRRSWFEY